MSIYDTEWKGFFRTLSKGPQKLDYKSTEWMSDTFPKCHIIKGFFATEKYYISKKPLK